MIKGLFNNNFGISHSFVLILVIILSEHEGDWNLTR